MDNQLQNSNSHQSTEIDFRVKATKTIWGCSVAMLGISIPLCRVTDNSLIPLCVLAAAAIGTTAIWFSKGFSNHASNPSSASTTITQEQLKALEERLANVEVISSFERGLNERAMSETTRVEHVPMIKETV